MNSPDRAILSRLRLGKGEGVSGAELSERLGISRAAIWARINDLRKLGYDIEASPHGGYRLKASPDLLHADDIQSRLPEGMIIGRDVRVFGETTSTNDLAEKLARDNVPEGAVVFAESQTKGRGRLGRAWMSPPRKGLWFSVLLRPSIPPQGVTRVTILAATAVRRAIHKVTGLCVSIKWPNDLLIDGRKVVGILTEMSAEMDAVRHVVLGIGVDANQSAEEFPVELRSIATSLAIEGGAPVDRPALAAQALLELELDYGKLRANRFAEVVDEWEAACATIGQRVTVDVGGRKIEGRAESIDDQGSLLVRTAHGRIEKVLGGDVRIER